jgi:hypothetical protein
LPYQDIFTFKISLEEINPCLFKEIKELEKTIIELFVKLQNNNYEVVIVSNANMKWINNCFTHFLEELKDYLNENHIKVYSAKNMYKKDVIYPQSKESADWKISCFEKVIKDLYVEEAENDFNINEGIIDLNVISIGDGEDEKKAVFKLRKNKFSFCQNLQCKFIRMIDYPSASSIYLQLKYLHNNINDILNSNNTIYKMNIEIVNGSTKVKCIPKKKKNKLDKLKIVSSSFNNSQNNLNKKNEGFLIFNNLYDYQEKELFNNNSCNYLERDEDLFRKNLFLGIKKYNKPFD